MTLEENVRKQIEEILAKAELRERIGNLPITFAFDLLNLIPYDVREDIPQEKLDKLTTMLKEAGFPDESTNKLVQDIYNLVPTKEMFEKMNKAKEHAEKYLPTLADKVIDGTPYIQTNHGKVELRAGPPDINGSAVKVPLVLRVHWQVQAEDPAKTRVFACQIYSGQNLFVEQTDGSVQIRGPSKEELRQSALEAALDYFTTPPPSLFSSG